MNEKKLTKSEQMQLSRHIEFRFPDKKITMKSKIYFNSAWYKIDTLPFMSEKGYFRFMISKIEKKVKK